jgi:fatty-acyl-CoA synthase
MTTPRTFNLADLFDIAAAAVPDREAVVIGATRLSYRQLADRISRLASWLHGRGIGEGDTVGLQLYNGIEYLEAFLAACKVKAVPVNINYRYVADELRYLYGNSGPSVLFYSAALADNVREARDAAFGLKTIVRVGGDTVAIPGETDYRTALAASPGRADHIARSDDDLSVLYTGGTTGKPKGVMWPHKALFFSALGGGCALNPALGPISTPEQLAERALAGPVLRSMPAAPLMHGAALWVALMGLFEGHTIVLSEKHQFDPEHILDLLAKEKVHMISIVGDAMAVPILDALRAHPGRWDLSNLVAFGNGGALFSAHVKKGLQEILPTLGIHDGSGSSEAGMFGSGSKPTTAGLLRLPPSPHLKVLVGGKRIAATGEQGILARTGLVPIGYLGDPKKTAETFITFGGQRFVLTGDIALQEEDGSIVVFGRDSNCINTGGEKVFVEEVEEALRRHPAVLDCLVLGLPDPRWGNKVVAVVALRVGATADTAALRAHCRDHLAGYKVPKDVVFMSAIQRSPAGKGDYRWARSVAEQALA